MTMMRLVSLKDFESHLRSSVTKLRSDATFCDVSLICSDFEVTAHKVILASSSDSFRRILQNNPHPHPIIYLTNVKKKDLVNLLNYMYEGEVEVAEEDTESLLKLFGELKVKGLEPNSSIHDNPRESAPDQAVQGCPTTWINQDVLDDVLMKIEDLQDGPESSAASTSLNQSILMELEDSTHGEDSRPENSTPALFQSSPQPSTFNLQEEGIAQGLVSDVASSASDKEGSHVELIQPSSSLHLQPDLDVEEQSEQIFPTKRLSHLQPHEDDGSLSPPHKKRSRLSRSRNRRPEISSEPVHFPCQDNDILDTDPSIQDPASELSQPGGKVSLSLADEVAQAGEEDCDESSEKQQNDQNIIVLTKTDSDQAKMKQIFANYFNERIDGTRAVWACKACEKVCDSKSHMNSHIDFRHTDHLVHQCLQCSLSFRNNDGLTRHIREHTLKLNQDDNNNSSGGRARGEGRLSASSRVEKMEWLQAQEAIMHAQLAKSTDTGLNLQIEDFGDAGRGLVTTCDRVKGDFVVEYAGELIDINTARVREEKYDREGDTRSYMYFFVHDGHKMCVDATEESDRLGRLINHSMGDPNLATRVVTVDGDPRLVLFTTKDIKAGTQLKFDYGDRNKETLEANPWMKE